MKVTRQDLIEAARRWRGIKFSHQGRSRKTGLDCGGLILVIARELGLSKLEELGYAAFPNNGRFEKLLNENARAGRFEGKGYKLTGKEFRAGDLLSFDYGTGEGTRHIALVSKFDGRHFWVVEANPQYDVCEHSLRPPFFDGKTIIKAWEVPGLAD